MTKRVGRTGNGRFTPGRSGNPGGNAAIESRNRKGQSMTSTYEDRTLLVTDVAIESPQLRDIAAYPGGLTWLDLPIVQALPTDPRSRFRILAGRLRSQTGLWFRIFWMPVETMAAMCALAPRLLVQAVRTIFERASSTR